jgi:hypothetical protein
MHRLDCHDKDDSNGIIIGGNIFYISMGCKSILMNFANRCPCHLFDFHITKSLSELVRGFARQFHIFTMEPPNGIAIVSTPHHPALFLPESDNWLGTIFRHRKRYDGQWLDHLPANQRYGRAARSNYERKTCRRKLASLHVALT